MGHPLTCCIVYFVVTGYCLSSEGSVLDIPEAAADVDQKTSRKVNYKSRHVQRRMNITFKQIGLTQKIPGGARI